MDTVAQQIQAVQAELLELQRQLAYPQSVDSLRASMSQALETALDTLDLVQQELGPAPKYSLCHNSAILQFLSESQYRLLFDYNPYPMWVYDTETLAFLAVNEAAVRTYGYSESEFLSLTIEDIRPSQSLEALRTFLTDLTPTWSRSGIWQHQTKDGRIIDVEVTSNALPFAGRAARLVLVNDVTEHIQAEVALRKSEANHQALLEAIPDLMIHLHRDGTYLDFKRAINFKTIMPVEMMVGQNIYDVMPYEIAQQRMTYIEQALQTQEIQVYEYEFEYQGSSFYEEARILACGVDEVLVIIRDISDRKQIEAKRQMAEAALLQRENYLAALVEVQSCLLSNHEGPCYPSVLKVLGKISSASRIYLFENHRSSQGALLMSQRAEWCAPGIESQLENPLLQNLSYDTFFPRWVELLTHGEIVTGLVADFPESERMILDPQGILSILILPLSVNQEFFGFIGFDHCCEARFWTAAEIDLLQSAAASISLAHERKQAELTLQKAKEDLNVEVQQRTLELSETIDQLWHEINERQRIEAALRESETRFRLLAENSTDMISRHDPSGVYLYASPACKTLLGYEPEALIGKLAYDFFHPDDLAAVAQVHQQTLNQPDTYTLSYRIRHQQGHYIWFESTAHSIRDRATAEILEIHVASRNITIRKGIEVELHKALAKERELNELKSRFVSMTSHEFRTPLTVILSSAKLIEAYGHQWTDDKKLTHLHRIQIAGKRMTQLLDDILILGKAEASGLRFEPTQVDVGQLCQSVVEDFRLGDRDNHAIALTLPKTFPPTYLDEKLLQHILANLLSNALKYSPKGTSVDLRVRYDDAWVIFEVQDQGIGIPAADHHRLFESFQRASNVGAIPGSGLGLAIVKKCIDTHQGQIAIDSVVGSGTLITVLLPYSSSADSISP